MAERQHSPGYHHDHPPSERRAGCLACRIDAEEQERDSMPPLIPAEQRLAVALLVQARELNNQGVRDAREVDRWHRYVDAFLYGRPGDDPKERLDDPARQEHRAFVRRLFSRGR